MGRQLAPGGCSQSAIATLIETAGDQEHSDADAPSRDAEHDDAAPQSFADSRGAPGGCVAAGGAALGPRYCGMEKHQK